MRTTALLALALSACGLPEPINQEVDPPPGADDALAIVVHEWSERMDVGLAVEDLPPVRWFSGDCLDYGDGCKTAAGEMRDGGYVHAPGQDPEIHILIRPTIYASSLTHEVLHWAIAETSGDKEGDNRHDSRLWADVPAVRAPLWYAGL